MRTTIRKGKRSILIYLIDTTICIYLIKNKYNYLHEIVENEGRFSIAISSVAVAELEYGLYDTNLGRFIAEDPIKDGNNSKSYTKDMIKSLKKLHKIYHLRENELYPE